MEEKEEGGGEAVGLDLHEQRQFISTMSSGFHVWLKNTDVRKALKDNPERAWNWFF